MARGFGCHLQQLMLQQVLLELGKISRFSQQGLMAVQTEIVALVDRRVGNLFAIDGMPDERSMAGFAGQPSMLALRQEFIHLPVVLRGSMAACATTRLIASELQGLCLQFGKRLLAIPALVIPIRRNGALFKPP
jgi:hypothetical protein